MCYKLAKIKNLIFSVWVAYYMDFILKINIYVAWLQASPTF
jgi:hypothetical protein